MAEDTKIPVTTDKAPSALRPRRPLESLRQEIDQLFDDFGIGTWRSPFRSPPSQRLGARLAKDKHRCAARR
jgi:HSP20 family protein